MTDKTKKLIPIIVIGGFLGAGKTTLVNRLLAHSNGENQWRRMVVFVNDFGAINIDYDLIDQVEENRVSLKNGCVCCTLNDDLIASITQFARAQTPPDAMIIETSGIANPNLLNQSLMQLEAAEIAGLKSRLYVLDTALFDRLEYEDREDIIDHAAASDLVLLNKIDIATATQLSSIRAVLAESAPYSTLVETKSCDIPVELPFGGNLLTLEAPNNRIQKSPFDKTLHRNKWTSWSVQTPSRVGRTDFEVFAKVLVSQCLRAKGRLCFAGDNHHEYRFNLVGARITLEKAPLATSELGTVLVAIGNAQLLQTEQLDNLFHGITTDQPGDNVSAFS